MLDGLNASPKRLPSKLLYDERGSELFEAITREPEYYPTRVEISIFQQYMAEMARYIGRDALVVEFGSGAGIKTRMLLEALDNPRAYIPIDISKEQLSTASRALAAQFPSIKILPVYGDYTQPLTIPSLEHVGNRVVFFPGSTIGNFQPVDAVVFLKRAAALVGQGGGLLIGFDLVKDRAVLHAAYNDAKGVTAAFNLNLIERIASAFGVDIASEGFEHLAFFNEQESRVEMHLVSRKAQHFTLDGEEIYLSKGEHIITEYSYKYTPDSFQNILSSSGFAVWNRWTDGQAYFEVCFAVAS